ncbi:MAG: hypothetical protein HYZ65_02205 [Burkholderiales bacterium]|nr:hypothetical protein [Burkholderiales bacterium]
MLAILSFELRQKFRSLSTYVYFLMFFSLAMLWMAAAGGAFSGAVIDFGGKVHINAPVAVSQTIAFLGYLGVVIVAAMMGRAVQQDVEHNIWHFFYSAPLTKLQYLGGRFLGAFLALLAIFSSLGLGAWLGCYLPGIEAVRLGQPIPAAYVMPYLYSIVPNFLVFGAIFFTLGALFRRMLPVYVASVVLLIGYMIASSFLRDLDNRTLGALLDPFGSAAISRVTEYWSIADKNSKLVPLTGLFLINRLIWGAVGIVMIVLCYWRFNFAAISTAGKQKKEKAVAAPAVTSVPRVQPRFSAAGLWQLFWRQSWLNLRETVKNVYFIVILLCGVLFMFALSNAVTKIYGTSTYPVTFAVLEVLGGSFSLFMLIITTFYAGELVWRERDARVAQLLDALPVPNWLPLLSKLLSLVVLQGALLAVLMLCGLLIQTFKGYTNYELGHYLFQLFSLQWPDYALLAVLAMAVQVIVNHKYVGYFVMIVYYIADIALPGMGIEHPMLRFGNIPQITYSAINGYGHFLPAVRWYQVFWGGASLMLLAAAMLLWVRGATGDLRGRLRLARLSLSKGTGSLLALGLCVFVGAGGVLFYYTNILNHYKNSFTQQAENAEYEKKYKQYESRPQPRITDVKLAVDIFPVTRTARIKGDYQLVNRTNAAINEIFIVQHEDARIASMQFDRRQSAAIDDREHNFLSYKLSPALQAGEKLALHFELEYAPKTLLGMSSGQHVLYNGTFFNSQLMPHIGYQPNLELSEEKERRKHGLPEKERMAEREDPKGLANSYISNDADWITFDAVVSTSADQMAIAPGTLKREWEQDGRRYFHYAPELPILNFYAFQSGAYSVKKAQWKDIPIEIDYQKGHEYNLERMVKGVQASLAYYTENYSPYQHKLVRIVEFPRYASFAQAFPNTIPYSEGIGFIAKVDDKDPKDIDYPFYITAHEMGHQWWAHQVVSGNTKGATVLVESLAQYSALMVMKQAYGEAKMRKFLKYELDRYLFGRSQERKKELPLAHNENQQYIHYQKGSLAMYLLQDMIGEDKVNAALREVIAAHANQGAPYANAKALVDALRKVTPQDKQYLIADLFESIILFENRALSASAKPVADGKYEVSIKLAANKLKADELGVEKEVALKDWIDIGVDDKDGNSLLRERKFIDRKEMTFSMIVKGEPTKAGIDPDNKYVDRKPDDNLIKVEMSSK